MTTSTSHSSHLLEPEETDRDLNLDVRRRSLLGLRGINLIFVLCGPAGIERVRLRSFVSGIIPAPDRALVPAAFAPGDFSRISQLSTTQPWLRYERDGADSTT